MLIFFADSDCDVTPDVAQKYGMRLISMPYAIDGEIIYPYEDFQAFDYKTYYKLLRDGTIPTTHALNPEDYKRYFEPVFQNGDDIVYVHFSGNMSGSFDYMKLAVDELLSRYPERKFYAADTGLITMGGLNLVEDAAELYRQGASGEQIVKWVEDNRLNYACYFYADDLKFFKRSGRVKGITATMGQMMGIRPIINIDSDGIMKSIGRERGRQKAIARLFQYVEEAGLEPEKHRFVIGHTDNEEAALQLIELLKAKYGEDINVQLIVVNPTAGAHCGPSGMGVSFYAQHR